MATGVGLRVAEDECTAAIVTDGDEEPQYIVREPVLHMSDDGDAVLGGSAPEGHSHSISGFADAVGDPAGISVDDGEAYRAEDLYATALFCLINLAADHLSGPAEFYAAHPAQWTPEHVRSLRDALDYLGLRSVVLVSEADLPSAEAGAHAKPSFAHDAARAALAAVLATPAGATPPDPSTAENATVDTIVIPAVPTPEAQPQAYSEAIPVAEPLPAVEPAQPQKIPAAGKNGRERTLVVSAVAALIGLVLGGIAVAALLRDDEQTPVPALPGAQSEQSTVSPAPATTTVELPTVPATTAAPEPPPVTAETTPPETTPPPPPSTTGPPGTPSGTGSATPTSRARSSRAATTTPYPFQQLPEIPTIPGFGMSGGG